MNTELDLNLDPEKGLIITEELTAQVGPQVVAFDANGLTDMAGTPFDPAIHKTYADGSPMTGSKNQLLLKKEAKKSAAARLKDKIVHMFDGQKPDETEVPENRKVPLSDHEIDQIPEEKRNLESAAPVDSAQRHHELTVSSENSADLYFIGGSMVFGVEFLNQRNRFHPDVARAIYDYEKRTGKSIDLPPGVALACGLGRIGWEIINREPECKKRFESGAAVIRNNAVKFIGRKLPKFGRNDDGGKDDQV